MKERPSWPMREWEVRAILDGRKTQARRIIKPQPDGERRPLSEWSLGLAAACHDHSPDPAKLAAHSARMEGRIFPFSTPTGGLMSPVCQYGQPGDKLWVRESCFTDDARRIAIHVADGTTYVAHYKRRNSIHMPRWASRLTLEVTGVRVERLQEISEADALSEGVYPTKTGLYPGALRAAYMELWDQINGHGSWEANPFVWVIEFKRAE